MFTRIRQWFTPKPAPVSEMETKAAPVLKMIREALEVGNKRRICAIFNVLSPTATAEICKRLTVDELCLISAALTK